MAIAKNPVLSVKRNPAAIITWTFTVNYTAVFASDELNERFNDCIELFEHDITSGDDRLTNGCVDAEDFVADRQEVPRIKQVTLRDDVVSTEVGEEEVYAIVTLSGQAIAARDSTRTTVVKVST
jgi:hypothetical protein